MRPTEATTPVPIPVIDGEVRAATIDVGGVFVVPDHGRIAAALRDAGVAVPNADTFWDAHYLAMHALDAARSPAETFDDYVPAFVHHLDLGEEPARLALPAVDALFGPSGLWVEPIAESIADLAAVVDAGVPVAIVSNADGTVADILRRGGICQAGPGPLTAVTTIVDSGLLGVAKPDPVTFAPAIEALAVPAAEIVHVGDSVHYDVVGARAAGMAAAHFDPRRLCGSTDHAHMHRLIELIDLIRPNG